MIQNKNTIDTLILGKAGEHRVLSELMLRGIEAAIVCCDNGIDLILMNGKKIQVKTANTLQQAWMKRQINPTKYYRFGMRIGKGQKLVYNNFDFMIGWIVPENEFYIIPVDICGRNTSIVISSKSKKYIKYKNNWNLLKE